MRPFEPRAEIQFMGLGALRAALLRLMP